jgi:hypothetical protein
MPQRNNLLRKTHEGTTDFWMAANYNEFHELNPPLEIPPFENFQPRHWRGFFCPLAKVRPL